jgi:hypothetical protein
LPGCVCVRTQAEQARFKIDKVVADEGISDVSTRLAERPEAKRQGAKSRGKIVFDAVNLTRWSFCFRRQTPTLGGGASSSPKMTRSDS